MVVRRSIGPALPRRRPGNPCCWSSRRRCSGAGAFHRQKAHLVLSALRHRAAELGDQAIFLRTETYGEALRKVSGEPLDVCHPTSRRAPRLRPGARRSDRPASRAASPPTAAEFVAWADGRHGRLRMEDFYRDARRRLDVLMDGDAPAGGKWNLDAENRQPPPAAPASRCRPHRCRSRTRSTKSVRADLDRWERDGIRFVGRGRPAPVPRDPRGGPGPRCATSSTTGCRRSARTRTRCSPTTRGWRTACCRRR